MFRKKDPTPSVIDKNPPTADETIDLGKNKSPKWWHFHIHWLHLSRRAKWLTALFVVALIAAVTVSILFLGKKATAPTATYKKAAPTTVASPLTGLQVSSDLAERPVTGVMIENSLDARPQSGLTDAGVVFEAIAEGGITRFLALFQEAQPQYVGPVRSLRPYYIDWAKGFDASIAHVGGSPIALKEIRGGGKDLDQFFNADAYWRVDSRAAPHNVYTSFKNLDKLNKSKGYTKSTFNSFLRKADDPAKTPEASTINLTVSDPLYNVSYTYRSSDNDYKRAEGGATHTSTTSASVSSAKIIRPKVVIAMVVGFAIDSDGQHSDYTTIGSGRAYIFQDGKVNIVTWRKIKQSSNITFLDGNNQPVAINAGQTWITIVDAKNDVTYKP